MDRKIAISWTDLTFKIKSVFSRKETIILNKLNGFAEFGTMTAVMGPSGAGLTSLLMCLNGINNPKLSLETKIRLNTSKKIRSTFVGHNEKEFLIMGLTAKQNLIYASKLKNSSGGQDVDHERNVQQIMADLMITDTMNTKAENCSGGEQKRLAIALELTAIKKPNIIFCDEPTTGLDSNLAEMVIQSLKGLSMNQNIAIISTIHQPNSDVLYLFDNLYVLAKGGVCIYSGAPHQLPKYLEESNVICAQKQNPIETLITIGSKDCGDTTIEELTNKTSSKLKQTINRRIDETKVKFIKHPKKLFNFKDVYFLLLRGMSQFISYKYKYFLFSTLSLILGTYFSTFPVSGDMGQVNDCILLNQFNPISCMDLVVVDHKVEQNIAFLTYASYAVLIVNCIIGVTDKIVKLHVFTNENRNGWYSCGVYYLTETISDFLPSSLNAALCSVLLYFVTNQPKEAKRFWAFFYIIQLLFHVGDAFAHMISIMLFRTKSICFLLTLVYLMSNTLFNATLISSSDLSDFIKVLTKTSIIWFTSGMSLIAIYGFSRCPASQVSKHLFMLKLMDDDIYWENSGYIWMQLATFKITGLVWMLFMQNLDKFDFLITYLNRMIPRIYSANNEIELSYISGHHTFERFCYINESEINPLPRVSHKNYSKTIDCETDDYVVKEHGQSQNLSIAWIDFTVRVEKSFFSEEKTILKEIKGFIQFGALTALMGPSGAGKSSLLRSLNGLNRNLLTKESKILLNNTSKIRICFIAQDHREHITKGLSVNQAIYYASKLKNTGKCVDHQFNVNQLITEFELNHIKNNIIEKCSSGEQKRIVLAMELSSVVKPNLICVDEPTSGIDNNTAFEMIKIFKSLAKKYKLSIITSIHQPNIQIVSTFDFLYVLAKGGVCVYSGRPQDLENHLNCCEVYCTEDQTPIEVLLKVGLNGCDDQTVIALCEKAKYDMKNHELRASHQLTVYPDGIPLHSKTFSLTELWFLFARTIICFFRHNFIIFWIQCAVYLLTALYTTEHFDFKLEKPDSCIPKVSNSCAITQEFIRNGTLVHYNLLYVLSNQQMILVYAMSLSSLIFSSHLKIFLREFRNRWYSIESYYLVNTFVDIIPIIILIVGYTAIIDSKYEETDDTFQTLLLILVFQLITSQSLGHIIGIVLTSNPVVGVVIFIILFSVFSAAISDRDLSDFWKQFTNLIPQKIGFKYFRVFFYGRGRCGEDQASSVLYRHEVYDHDFDKAPIIMVLDVCLYYILAFIFLKIRANFDSIQLRFKNLKQIISPCKST